MIKDKDEAQQWLHKNKIDISKNSTVIVSESGDVYLDPDLSKPLPDGIVVKGVEKPKKPNK